jgi:hypothetical protein
VQARLSRFGASLRHFVLLNVTLMPRVARGGSAADAAKRLARARFLSQSAPVAMLWSGEAGGRLGTRLRTDVYRESCLRAVGLRDGMRSEGSCIWAACQRRGTCLCAVHRRLCGYYSHSRHNIIVRDVADFIREAGVSLVSVEDGTPFHARMAGTHRAVPLGRGDVVVRHDTTLSTGSALWDSLHWIIDVSFGDPASSAVREHAWHTAGFVAAGIGAYKHHKYRSPGTSTSETLARRAAVVALPPSMTPVEPQGPAALAAAALVRGPLPAAPALWAPADCLYAHDTHVFMPFEVETHGRLGPGAHRLLRALAIHATGGPGRGGNAAARGRLLQRWHTRLSCAVTMAVSLQSVSHPGPILSAAAVDAAAAARRSGGPPPEFLATSALAESDDLVAFEAEEAEPSSFSSLDP